jgi:hypothetical protein
MDELVSGSLLADLSDEESRELARWRLARPENERLFLQVMRLCRALEVDGGSRPRSPRPTAADILRRHASRRHCPAQPAAQPGSWNAIPARGQHENQTGMPLPKFGTDKSPNLEPRWGPGVRAR